MSKQPSNDLMKIGELAEASGVSVRSIRHYDQHGMLASSRSGNGYRAFQPVSVNQVKQIQRLVAAGFSLEEIRSFPECMLLIEGALACPETSEIQRKRLAILDKQIEMLDRQRSRLRAMLIAST
ncbi:MerR family transcriptional regulator [Stenotrophomonas sp. SORGH_AS_0282]|jgi:DNA-binding transcriptional MerR regulator|uniref:MerR family transcriptional regulator n=1 Tax=Stenotrophomonas sp. SORGH_AS_0282 TaxID=3041763 RepID=UPI002784E2FE|nr:MerR family transcriptional regulator [Stenotrophomonas sp. SORGH_AS_0282]MDQ1062658.1 MerR family copper efflux transcriptional regulator [Stenotrophomonas sp. SORGH_AS_0282]MDQ1188987.1 MerR family copper efflux transcriptional regulator [Stenotrophomonas sp. SORGH_AS_0282]